MGQEINKFLETNENEGTAIQNLCDTENAVLRRKFIAIQAYHKKIETFQINNLTVHLQELEEQQQRQPRASTRKEITKFGRKLIDIETKSTILKINKSRTWIFEKINKLFLILIFYCYSITVVCPFSPYLHPNPAKPPSLPHFHPPP